jgi:hypothetical protein
VIFRYVDVRTDRIVLAESLRWTPRARRSTFRGVRWGAIIGLLVGLSVGATAGALALVDGQLFLAPITAILDFLIFVAMGVGIGILLWIMTVPLGAFIGALLGMLVSGDGQTEIPPTQGVRRSATHAALTGAATVLVTMIAAGSAFLALATVRVLVLDQSTDSGVAILEAIGMTVLFTKLAGALVAFAIGGEAVISHLLLRFCLWRAGVMPLRYGQFLNHAVERILLRRVSGGYAFAHRLIQEHVAKHEQALIERLKKREEPRKAILADAT